MPRPWLARLAAVCQGVALLTLLLAVADVLYLSPLLAPGADWPGREFDRLAAAPPAERSHTIRKLVAEAFPQLALPAAGLVAAGLFRRAAAGRLRMTGGLRAPAAAGMGVAVVGAGLVAGWWAFAPSQGFTRPSVSERLTNALSGNPVVTITRRHVCGHGIAWTQEAIPSETHPTRRLLAFLHEEAVGLLGELTPCLLLLSVCGAWSAATAPAPED